MVREFSVTRLGDFWKFLVTKFGTKEAQKIANILGYFVKPHLYVKNVVAIFVQFWRHLGYFLLQLLITLVEMSLQSFTIRCRLHCPGFEKSSKFWKRLSKNNPSALCLPFSFSQRVSLHVRFCMCDFYARCLQLKSTFEDSWRTCQCIVKQFFGSLQAEENIFLWPSM